MQKMGTQHGAEPRHQDSKRPSARPPGSEPYATGLTNPADIPRATHQDGSARGPALNCLQGPFHLLRVLQPLPRARSGCLHPHPHPHVWSQHLFLDDPQTANPQHTQNQVPPALVSHTSLPGSESSSRLPEGQGSGCSSRPRLLLQWGP